MDQKKTGTFLRDLRKIQNFTQEQAAEKLGVSSRTISRWETGEYMPDISILVEIADMYEVDVREIISGERMDDNMNSEIRDVAKKMADYSTMEKKSLLKWIKTMSVATLIVSTCNILINAVKTFFMIKEFPSGNTAAVVLFNVFSSSAIVSYILMAISVLVILQASGKLGKIEQNKKTSIIVKVIVVIAVIIAMFTVFQAFVSVMDLYKLN